MCHQVIEKVLKAYWTATRDDDPPYIHSHLLLLKGSGLEEEVSKKVSDFLDMMIPMNIEARYPQYKQEVAAKLNKDICKYILEQTQRFHQWILQKL